MGEPRQYVLVSGVDFDSKDAGFRYRVDARRSWLERHNKTKADQRFITMDALKGEIEVREVSRASGRRVEQVSSTRPFAPVTSASYVVVTTPDPRGGAPTKHHVFKPNQPSVMSITDIYRQIREIGAAAGGQLHEFSVFSHGWMGGPILVNSYDDRQMEITTIAPDGTQITHQVPVTGASRDPDDKDPRITDFQPPTMDAAALADFAAAFHPDGYSWLWGCSFPKVVHHGLVSLRHAKGYRDTGLAETVELELTRLETADVAYLEELLAPVLGKLPSRTSVKAKFGFVRWAFGRANLSCYATTLARFSKHPVRGALLGTYAEYDQGGDRLMNVPAFFAGSAAFYRNYLGLLPDPEGRRYGIYPPDFTVAPPPVGVVP